MRSRNSHISYSRKKIFEVLRTLNELVVSLDRLGSAEMPKRKLDAALSNFVQQHQVFRKAARARKILSEPFSTIVGADGMDELEREMQGIKYWKARKQK